MKTNNMIKSIFCFVCTVVLIASCSIGRTPNSSFYSLVTAATPSMAIKGDFSDLNIVIKNISIPSYLDRPQIVLREADGTKITISELNRWAGNLGDNIKLVLAEDMSIILNDASIKPLTFGDKDYKYAVSVEINRFDAFVDGRAEISAWWNIEYGKNFTKNVSGQFKFSDTYDGSYDDMVRVQSEMLKRFAEVLAKEIVKNK